MVVARARAGTHARGYPRGCERAKITACAYARRRLLGAGELYLAAWLPAGMAACLCALARTRTLETIRKSTLSRIVHAHNAQACARAYVQHAHTRYINARIHAYAQFMRRLCIILPLLPRVLPVLPALARGCLVRAWSRTPPRYCALPCPAAPAGLA